MIIAIPGTALDHNNVAKRFKRVLRNAGLVGHRLYDLRHTFASELLARCAPITYVSHQLGHRSPDTTLKFYARWIPREGKSFVNLLDSEGLGSIVRKVGTKVGTKLPLDPLPSPQVVESIGSGGGLEPPT